MPLPSSNISLRNTNNYLAIVPDKNYYFGPAYGYPTMDYEEMVRFVQDALPGFTYVDLFNVLTLSDYYKTDTHWSQDRLGNVVKALSEAMGFEKKLNKQYQISQFDEFKGVYYGQSALNPDKDTIYYLSDEIIKSCTVFDYNSGKKMRMYNLSALGGSDAYDVFLSGPQPLLRIDNPNATTNKQLILFRDSYGSSLAPLLAEGYSSIFVVDIRYISPSELGKYIRFDGQDVLFLYSTMILNDSFSFLS